MTNVYGLFVGINNYPGSEADLAGCVNDANDWEKLFKPACKSTAKLLDSQATRTEIADQLAGHLRLLKSTDMLVFTFSGHGSWVPDRNGDEGDGRDECLCPYDYEQNVLLDDTLRAMLVKRAQGSRVLMITDSCHSGSVFRLIGSPTRGMPVPRFLPPSRFLTGRAATKAAKLVAKPRRSRATAAPLPNVIHLAGCRDHEYSYDAYFRGRPNGALTYHAIKAYKSLAVRSKYSAWLNKIRQSLPSFDYPQTPLLNATPAVQAGVIVGKGM